ncbi:hypothetical protein TNCV_3591381 [Trichonephila clavipes]|nr:hypothetical protein TNCV_3591381 [Trichonephila clavipes]
MMLQFSRRNLDRLISKSSKTKKVFNTKLVDFTERYLPQKSGLNQAVFALDVLTVCNNMKAIGDGRDFEQWLSDKDDISACTKLFEFPPHVNVKI